MFEALMKSGCNRLSMAVCRCSQPAGRNSCSIVSGDVSNLVQQPSWHYYLNLAKIRPNQVIADFGRGSSVSSESE